MWFLVEYTDEKDVFPSYGVVNSSSLPNEDSEVHPGKIVFIRSKRGYGVKRAQVLRISDDKRQMKEHKMLLERQDRQVRNMLTICMQTIKELKTEPLMFTSMNASPAQTANGASGSRPLPPEAADDDSDSDSETEIINDTRNLQINKPPVKTPAQFKQMADYNVNGSSSVSPCQKIKTAIVNSTPFPTGCKKTGNNIASTKLTFDQGTQTDDTNIEVPIETITKIESILIRIHQHFLHLISGLQIDYQDHADDGVYNFEEGQNMEENLGIGDGYVGNETADSMVLNKSNIETQDLRCDMKARSLQIRRVSAHTTNNVETNCTPDRSVTERSTDMVPIGAGHAIVPARLLNEIDWDSYSAATRQLLQAIFPRKVLATSSLTGKKSPAFADVPAKKCLDPDLIGDIVDTVSERCGVPKRLVRNCITIKCTDEAKLYRSRMQNKNKSGNLGTLKRENQENMPPSPHSHASSNVE